MFFHEAQSSHTSEILHRGEVVYLFGVWEMFFRESLFFIYDSDLIRGKSHIGDKRVSKSGKSTEINILHGN
ncbi:unnamed protein product [Staurois parvus]|uniref:Uncharacterized protein n=1 Tax=Staurois parvus TaxID=386267 RepID=A0ABN9AN32_9NEOB|nr:unnamed protein product [Staurois parvus]